MKIAVNTQHLLKNRLEGIGWFAHETLSRIVHDHPEHEFVFIFDRQWDQSFVYGKNVKAVRTTIPSRHPFLWFWHYEIDIPRILRKFRPDVFLSPDGWISLRTKVPTVDVIHDINFAHRPSDFPFFYRKYYNFFFPRYAKKAKRVITVSEFSKADMVRTYGLNPQKIDVAYNGCNALYSPLSHEVQAEIRKRYTNGKPYFIYVGSRNPRKNIAGLLAAFEQFKANDDKEVKLLFVGEPMWGASYLSEQITQMQYADDLVFTGRLSTEVLQMVLASAEALMLVSFNEGFGIPVVEAMHCDVPVICSKVASLPEVAGDAALYVDPNNVDSIANAMQQIIAFPDLRKSLVMKGRMQREKFNWDLTAQKVWESIEKALQ
jgi:glycosyltransferase involved in cell wall biosynthesis